MTSTEVKQSKLIIDDESLVQAIDNISNADVLAVDTEFMREKTYHAELCLLQIATADAAYLIDPLANLDLGLLYGVFCESGAVKVFHAGAQDLEILYLLYGKPVSPVFDTQIAAALLGRPQQLGLAALLKYYLGVELKKQDTYSDWSKRPFREAQVEYALDDVRYLPEVYARMQAELAETGRLHWLDEEFASLSDPLRFTEATELLWQKFKGTGGFNRRQLGILQELALWRDQVARQKDVPRRWVVGDEQLVDIAKRKPASKAELFTTRGLQGRLTRQMTTDVLAAVMRGQRLKADELPQPSKPPPRSPGFTSAVDLMQALVHLRAAENQIAANILASNDELKSLAAGKREGLSILHGWRRELIGNELLELLDGSLALSMHDGSMKVSKVP
ncbi:MAG: ribonuclease D [Coriobacteriia bacterium]|nr:ribonuclease D [Coriobacteriia bacterium]